MHWSGNDIRSGTSKACGETIWSVLFHDTLFDVGQVAPTGFDVLDEFELVVDSRTEAPIVISLSGGKGDGWVDLSSGAKK